MNQKLKDGKALVKCGSHRARSKVYNLIGRKPQSYWSLYRETAKGIIEITPDELEKIKAAGIKGVTQTHWSDDLNLCWSRS